MPSCCVVVGCKTGYKSSKNNPNPVKRSVFKFPCDIEMKVKWIAAIGRLNWNPNSRSVVCERHFIDSDRIHSGYIFAFSLVGCAHGSRIQIWDFKKATDPTTNLPLLPYCSHTVYMEPVPALVLHADAFGVLTLNQEMGPVNSRYIIWSLNFLPICNFCKQVKKRLLKCASCMSAKYCSSVCQKTDWNHHRDLCRKIKKSVPFTLA